MDLFFIQTIGKKVFGLYDTIATEESKLSIVMGLEQTLMTLTGKVIGKDCQARSTALKNGIESISSHDDRFILENEIIFYSHLEANPPYMEFSGKIIVTNSPS
jgi:hypothetical protein